MSIRTLVLGIVALSSVSALAIAATPAVPPLKLSEVVARMEARYPGEVVAIALDAAGDKPAHYHVDMRFPDSGLARVEVDAATLELASRFPERIDSGAATLPEVASLIGGLVPGQITAVELDSTVGTPAHYDVDVRLPDGPTARLKVDARTRRIAWREPAVVVD